MACRVECNSEENRNESVSCNTHRLIVIVYNAIVVWAALTCACRGGSKN